MMHVEQRIVGTIKAIRNSRVRFAALSLTMLVAACASTGVVPMGRDTYMLSKSGTALSSGATVKASLYREADAWCRKQGLVMVPLSEDSSDGVPGRHLANAEIRFRAVSPGDVENQRTNMKPVANTIVEVHNQ